MHDLDTSQRDQIEELRKENFELREEVARLKKEVEQHELWWEQAAAVQTMGGPNIDLTVIRDQK